jgi:hypothetical protein
VAAHREMNETVSRIAEYSEQVNQPEGSFLTVCYFFSSSFKRAIPSHYFRFRFVPFRWLKYLPEL